MNDSRAPAALIGIAAGILLALGACVLAWFAVSTIIDFDDSRIVREFAPSLVALGITLAAGVGLIVLSWRAYRTRDRIAETPDE